MHNEELEGENQDMKPLHLREKGTGERKKEAVISHGCNKPG